MTRSHWSAPSRRDVLLGMCLGVIVVVGLWAPAVWIAEGAIALGYLLVSAIVYPRDRRFAAMFIVFGFVFLVIAARWWLSGR
jgi:hypothetical protein